jgi:hypothetical protein
VSASAVRADTGLLSALAIAYGRIGVHDRDARLADTAAHVGRPLASSAELTADEARALRKHLPRCTPDNCRSTTQAPTEGTAPAPIAAGAAGTAPEPAPVSGRRAPDAAPQVSPSHSHAGEGGGPGASDAPAGPLAAERPRPTNRDRYCPPAICWCGSCSWWKPAPPINYAAAIAKLAETAGSR